MTDTLHLVLHDLQKHSDIVRALLEIKKKSHVKADVYKHGGTLRHSIDEYTNNNEEISLSHTLVRKVKEQPSSHYKIIINISPGNDCITFNFSVPKYFYATNIIQAVTTPSENAIMLRGHNSTLSHQLDEAFERLIVYIESFFHCEFPHCEVYWDKLELKRIDICYNQIFRNKNEALEYLKLQKTLKRKYFRENSHDVNNYKTAVFFACKDYSYKIYHKGTEYAKNDKLEHEKINKQYDKEIFDLKYLQEFSDRILRYEFTFRQGYMSYLYNQKVFRCNSANYRQFKKLYNSLKGAYAKDQPKDEETNQIYEVCAKEKKWTDPRWVEIEKVHQKAGQRTLKNYDSTLTQWLYDWYTVKKNDHKPNKDQIIRIYTKFFQEFDKMITTGRRFWFQLNEEEQYLYDLDNRNMKNFLNSEKQVLFTRELFKAIGNRFMEFVNEFQIERKQPTELYLQKIDEYNAGVSSSRKIDKRFPLLATLKKQTKLLDKAKLGMVLMCLENYDMTDIQNILGVTRQTIHNYKKQLALIGYSKLTINDSIDFKVDTTFEEYFYEIDKNRRTLFVTSPLMVDFTRRKFQQYHQYA